MEASNVKAMRDALEMMSALFSKGVICTSYANTPEEMEQIEELYRKAKAALAKPPRNCDMGTAEEQAKRMDAYCASHGERIGGGWRCENCPLCSINRCELVWAQMPYEKGEPDGSK